MIEFNFKKGSAYYLANVLRQTALTRRNVLRPIACQISGNSNVLSCGELILEDMIEVQSLLASLSFYPENILKEGDILEIEYICSGEFRIGDLNQNGILTVLNNDRYDEALLHTVPSDGENTSIIYSKVPFKVYFRFASGNSTADANEYYLFNYLDQRNANINRDSIVFTNSRHNDITAFAYEVDETGLDYDTVKFRIQSDNSTEGQVLKEAKETLFSLLAEL